MILKGKNYYLWINIFIMISIFIYITIKSFFYLTLEELYVYISFKTIIFIFFFFFLIALFKKNYSNRLFGLIIGWYIILAYHVKLGIMLGSFNNLSTISSNDFLLSYIKILPNITFQTIWILLLVYIGVIWSSNKKILKKNKKRINLNILFKVILFSLILKFIVHFVFFLGLPGLNPKDTIPIISGLMTFYVRFALFSLLNLYLFYSIFSKSNKHLFFSFVMICIYVLIDIIIGVKYSLFYQSFSFVIIYFLTKKYYKLPKSYIIIVLIFVFTLIIIYNYIGYYRNALIYGHDMSTAIDMAIRDTPKDKSFIQSIFIRIAGIEKIVYIVTYFNNLTLDISSFFNGEFTKDFTSAVTGSSNVNNAIGATQIGMMYLISKQGLIYFLTSLGLYILIFFTFFTSLKLLAQKVFFLEEMKLISMLLGIYSIYFFFGSGNGFFFFKELLIVIISIYFIINLVRK